MHCNAFLMLYLKDGPLRMYALILYFAGNIKCQGVEGGRMRGRERRGRGRGIGWEF